MSSALVIAALAGGLKQVLVGIVTVDVGAGAAGG